METVTLVVERIKVFGKLTERFFNGAIQRCSSFNLNPHNDNPIEILKRLQREAFSDLMKLRDQQDKVERMISSSRSSKEGPFQESNTHMKGIVDVTGAVLFTENDDQHDALEKAGTRAGIDLRFIFETAVRQQNLLIVEFVAGKNILANDSNLSLSSLALEKVTYLANINEWLSVITTPLGARCGDYGITSSFTQGQRLGSVSSLVPPLFSQYYNCGSGVLVKGSNFAASLAELVSGLGAQPDATGSTCLNTFGQLTYQPFEGTSLTFSCLWQMHRTLSLQTKLGTLVIPLGHLKRRARSDVQVQASSSGSRRKAVNGFSSRTMALMLELEFSECNNLGGWVEIQDSSSDLLQWGVSFSDIPEDEVGWGLRMAGKSGKQFNQLQLEGFLNFCMGKDVSLQPGLVYAMDGKTQTPALVFRSSWSM